jgi:integrase
LIPGEVSYRLASVRPLQVAEEGVAEKPEVKGVPEEIVFQTLPYLPVMVRDIVRVMLLCGARCSELCMLRPCDVDFSDGDTWTYKPSHHKSQRRGKDRFVYFGSAAQALLRPWLEGVKAGEYVFSPARSEANRLAARSENRQTSRWPSHMKRNVAKRKKVRQRQYHARYEAHSVSVAIRRACQAVDERMRRAKNPDDHREPKEVPKEDRLFPFWSVHQLRHTSGTRVRKEFGAEVAQIFLGHSQLSTTEIYAEPDREAVKRAVAKLG